MKIVIYSRPDCDQCLRTKQWLDRFGFTYQDIDIDADQDAARDVRNIVRANKLNQALPLVIVSNDLSNNLSRTQFNKRVERWTGFRIEQLRGLRETEL